MSLDKAGDGARHADDERRTAPLAGHRDDESERMAAVRRCVRSPHRRFS